MADDVDMANVLADQHRDRCLRAARAARAAEQPGAPGECTQCGEDMPRLVNGRCGYCRDGRRPR
ncbi:conjugal transfer protein TraR [Sphingopyxis sp.]|uniref:conjugal transfer protein TraR n=1 Tax=Sphingopyxis sp. TaxID=1908224 RepID=UPI002D7EDA56|nr:conjugal transfer protein TraR [Sphingopyxis sp.]